MPYPAKPSRPKNRPPSPVSRRFQKNQSDNDEIDSAWSPNVGPVTTDSMSRKLDDQIALRLPAELRDRLEHDAASEGRSLGNMTRRILERWYREHEQPEVAA